MKRNGWFDDPEGDDLFQGVSFDDSPLRVDDGPDFDGVKAAADRLGTKVRGIDWNAQWERVKNAPKPAKIAAGAVVALLLVVIIVPRVWSAIDARMHPPEGALTDYYALLAAGKANEALALASDPNQLDVNSPFLTSDALVIAQQGFTVESITYDDTASSESYGSETYPDTKYLQALVQTSVGRGTFSGSVTRSGSDWKLGQVTDTISVPYLPADVLLNGQPFSGYATVFPGTYRFTLSDPARELVVTLDGQPVPSSALSLITPGLGIEVGLESQLSQASLNAAQALAKQTAEKCAKQVSYSNLTTDCQLNGYVDIKSGSTNVVVTSENATVSGTQLNENGTLTYTIEIPVKYSYDYQGYFESSPTRYSGQSSLSGALTIGFIDGVPAPSTGD